MIGPLVPPVQGEIYPLSVELTPDLDNTTISNVELPIRHRKLRRILGYVATRNLTNVVIKHLGEKVNDPFSLPERVLLPANTWLPRISGKPQRLTVSGSKAAGDSNVQLTLILELEPEQE